VLAGGRAGRTWRERHTEGLRACWPRASDRSRVKQRIHPTTADFTSRASGAATDPAQDPGREYDPFVNWAAVGRGEVTAAIVEYARMGLAGVVPPCLHSPRTRAKWFHAALRRVFRATGRPVHVWEYRSHD